MQAAILMLYTLLMCHAFIMSTKQHTSCLSIHRTNLPKEIMLFPELPMDDKQASFLHHSEIKNYLEKYIYSFGLDKFIQFGQIVENVSPVPLQSMGDDTSAAVDTVKWVVSTRCVKSGESKSEEFDFVFICSGYVLMHAYMKLGVSMYFLGNELDLARLFQISSLLSSSKQTFF